jgi:nucleoside-diphosphate-sugar epimerase
MRVFVTGASGFIGSAVVPELIGAGHQVIGLARSDASAAAIAAAGAEVQRGSLDDLDSLRAGAGASDGVIHLAFIHDFANFEASVAADVRAIETLTDELAGTDRPLVIVSGTLGLAPGRVGTEIDMPDPATAHPRIAGTHAALEAPSRGVRSSVARLAPSVHGPDDHGFVPMLIAIAREKGVSAYIGDGENRWPGVHVLDAAVLFRLAVERAPAGSILHGIADEGVPTRTIAEVIGRHLDVPVVSVAPEDAVEHFGWIGPIFATDAAASSALTRELLGWEPTHPGLVEDLDEGHYFSERPVGA